MADPTLELGDARCGVGDRHQVSPGSYAAIIRGVNGTTGMAIVEVYQFA